MSVCVQEFLNQEWGSTRNRHPLWMGGGIRGDERKEIKGEREIRRRNEERESLVINK